MTMLALGILLFISNVACQISHSQTNNPLIPFILKEIASGSLEGRSLLLRLRRINHARNRLHPNLRTGLIPIDELIQAVFNSSAFNSTVPFGAPVLARGGNSILFDGDVIIPLDEFAKIRRNVGTRRGKRAAIKDTKKYWPNGIVFVMIGVGGFSQRDKQSIAAVFNEISERTCICFRILGKANPYVPHVRITDNLGCASYVGVLRHPDGTFGQILSLALGCRIHRIIMHEFLHALGLYHEQSRPDRDYYVEVRRGNIQPQWYYAFHKYGHDVIDSRSIKYDYLSVMHYGNKFFSKNGGYTLVPIPETNKQKYLNVIGRVPTMSRRDEDIINRMYRCPPREPLDVCSEYPYRIP
ncbi:zinc metalloproteinase nas-15-like [Ylistrum balloti]|uniref:zinc metalloproteinase nas-15-like n=1 Tax=Ylistrum balloti TaxID=509963 RepID=UPI0029057E30|nr:zinc metalloproteinase nas-15-like [Ylistrum balloti]